MVSGPRLLVMPAGRLLIEGVHCGAGELSPRQSGHTSSSSPASRATTDSPTLPLPPCHPPSCYRPTL
ncbi:hypothetical protein E2C01_048863 [Portunus trituberculatus]|uniref:Uncharacterized protein n=1 Tax=Portunus trituberculatus TaxID=210409 RepID=A0A5B7GEH5_PORTR|nr:hypothetical protein [Portunus trituberculatus]